MGKKLFIIQKCTITKNSFREPGNIYKKYTLNNYNYSAKLLQLYITSDKTFSFRYLKDKMCQIGTKIEFFEVK